MEDQTDTAEGSLSQRKVVATVNKPSGNKYHRKIKSVEDIAGFTTADVYSVLEAFEVACPARQHAIKKLLCSGLRGKGDTMQDLTEARDAVDRAIVLEKQRQGKAE